MKTDSGGVVKLDDLKDVVKEHMLYRKKETLRRGWKQEPETLFFNEEGNPIDPDNMLTRKYYKCLKKAGLRQIRFHDLRHTFASLHLQNGESLAYVRDQLGHSSIKITVDIYGHLEPGSNKSASDRLLELHPGAPYGHPEGKSI